MTDDVTLESRFMHNGKEMKWSGRIAVNRDSNGKIVRKLYELTPIEPTDAFNAWLAIKELYFIETCKP